MSKMADLVVPIPRFEELSPAFQARSRWATERLGVTVNSVHACPFGGIGRGDAGSSAAPVTAFRS
jgi:hypothetical protein